MAYRLVITGAARKDVHQLPKEVLERADPRILALAENPRPFGSEKLKGFEGLYRIRAGKYRIIYEIDKAGSTATVAKVEHRKGVYRKLWTIRQTSAALGRVTPRN